VFLARRNDYKLFTAFQPISSPEILQVQSSSRTNDIGLNNYFWSSILLRFVAQEDRVNSKWAEVQAAITALGDDKILADIYSFSVLPTCKLVYSQGPVQRESLHSVIAESRKGEICCDRQYLCTGRIR